MNLQSSSDLEVPVLDPGAGQIPLFMPHIPKAAADHLLGALESRWIGQGPKVEAFESAFSQTFAEGREVLSTGSGTDALHLSYLLAGIERGDEVVTPLFTCTATNIPLLYLGAKPKFVDIDSESLNISVDHLRSQVTERTKAIVVVHYGGLPCDMDEIRDVACSYGIPVIEDAAHALGADYKGIPVGAVSEFTMFSFQAIKHITTGDGGMISLSEASLAPLGKSLRWFGIDRPKKQRGIWDNDITEVGFKYQMTDLAAALGLAALEEWSETLAYRRQLQGAYLNNLSGFSDVTILGRPGKDRGHAAWLMTVAVERRRDLQQKLFEAGIESNQVHYRNDRYSIFGGRQDCFPNMDEMEEKYLVLPMHTRMSVEDVERICEVIKEGW